MRMRERVLLLVLCVRVQVRRRVRRLRSKHGTIRTCGKHAAHRCGMRCVGRRRRGERGRHEADAEGAECRRPAADPAARRVMRQRRRRVVLVVVMTVMVIGGWRKGR